MNKNMCSILQAAGQQCQRPPPPQKIITNSAEPHGIWLDSTSKQSILKMTFCDDPTSDSGGLRLLLVSPAQASPFSSTDAVPHHSAPTKSANERGCLPCTIGGMYLCVTWIQEALVWFAYGIAKDLSTREFVELVNEVYHLLTAVL